MIRGGLAPPVLSRVNTEPPEELSAHPGVLPPGLNVILPIVREVSNVTVIPVPLLMSGKVAVWPAPLAMPLVYQLAAVLQLPLVTVVSQEPSWL